MSTISPRHWVRVSVLIAATLILLPSKLSFAIVGSGGISSSNGTLSVDSSQTGFLANSSSVTCSSSTGKLIVETDGNTLGWCNGSTAYRTALGDTSGKALSGDSATNFFASGILESTIGGTGNGFTKFSGPTTSEKTFTLPDASTTICTTNSTCSGYQAALTGGDVTTTSGGASATIGNDKITEPMLKSVNAPTDEQCLTYEATVGDFEWQACASGGSGITGITADSGGATTGTAVTLTGGSGITTTRATDTITIASASSEAGFLSSGALTCGASTAGKAQVHTTPLQYCDNAATPALQYAAYGDSSGNAKTGDSATAFFSSGILESSIGGTANGWTKFSGPNTSEKTFTLPNETSSIFTSATGQTLTLSSTSTLSAANGGTITATSVNPGTSTGTDGSRVITMPDNVSATPSPPAANLTNIYSRSGVGYVQPSHVASGWGYQIQASQVELGSNTTQAITFSTSVALTLASLNSIQFTLKANKKYWLQGSLYAIASAATADPTYAITISAGTKTIAVRVTCAMVDGTAAYTSMSIVADNTGTTCAIAGTGTTGGVTAMFDGYVSTTSDATLDIKASPAGTGTLTIQAYPLFRLTEFLDP